jgi:hypothetical protein
VLVQAGPAGDAAQILEGDMLKTVQTHDINPPVLLLMLPRQRRIVNTQLFPRPPDTPSCSHDGHRQMSETGNPVKSHPEAPPVSSAGNLCRLSGFLESENPAYARSWNSAFRAGVAVTLVMTGRLT